MEYPIPNPKIRTAIELTPVAFEPLVGLGPVILGSFPPQALLIDR